MKNRVLIGIMVSLVAIVVVWVLIYTPQAPAASTSNFQTNSTQEDTLLTITYTNQGFSPQRLSVKSGQTINILNKSELSLEFASGSHPDHSQNPELNVSEIEPGHASSFKVVRVGTWVFHNHFAHDHAGTLTVTK